MGFFGGFSESINLLNIPCSPCNNSQSSSYWPDVLNREIRPSEVFGVLGSRLASGFYGSKDVKCGWELPTRGGRVLSVVRVRGLGFSNLGFFYALNRIHRS